MRYLILPGAVLGGFAAAAVGVLYYAFVMTVLWGWFVVPTFLVPQLSISVAIGLLFTTALFREISWSNMSAAKDFDSKYKLLATLGKPTLILFFGWIAHQFV